MRTELEAGPMGPLIATGRVKIGTLRDLQSWPGAAPMNHGRPQNLHGRRSAAVSRSR